MLWSVCGKGGNFNAISQLPSVSKSNWLHVDIFQSLFIKMGVYSLDSSKPIGESPEVLNCNRLILELNRFICM